MGDGFKLRLVAGEEDMAADWGGYGQRRTRAETRDSFTGEMRV